MSGTDAPTSWKKTAALSVLVLGLAAGLTAVIFSTEPTAARGGATKKTAMLVEVIRAERGTFRPRIVVTGTVQPSQDIILSPRVTGTIIDAAPEFIPGGFVEEGATLLRIDPADYRNALAQRQSDLSQAIADLELEMGSQNLARQNYELLDGDLSEQKKSLVLRKPQLVAAKTRVEAARAAVNQAKLNLRRTTIEAPFDAQVLSRNVNIGSQVAAGDALARLVGVDTFWVIATVPLSKRRWLSFTNESADDSGSEVKIRNRSAWPEGVYRTGRLHKLVGALDDRTRMARVIITVSDPLARETGSEEDGGASPPLIVGEFVETRILGKAIHDVVRLDRDYVRKGDTVWVMDDGALHIRDAEVVLRDADHAYISKGLDDGDRVVTTNLSTVTEGAPLRTQADEQVE